MTLSYSRVESYRTCPLKYKLLNIDRVETVRGPRLIGGDAMHKALKMLYDPGRLEPPAADEVIETFMRTASEIPADDSVGQGLVLRGIETLRMHYSAALEVIRQRRTIGAEVRFSFAFDEGHHIQGYIDRVDALSADHVELIDYKTGRVPTQPVLDSEDSAVKLQMACYRLASERLYPGKQATMTVIYTDHNFFPMHVALPAETLEETRWLIRDTIAGIESGRFDPKIDRHCDWCEVRRNCPVWKTPEPPPGADVAAAAAEFHEIGEQLRELEGKRKKLRDILLAYAEAAEARRFEAGDAEVIVSEHERFSYDAQRLRAVLEPLGLWEKVQAVDKKAADELLKGTLLDPAQKRAAREALVLERTERHVKVNPRGAEAEEEETDDAST
jgi:RecB family exonuclease